MKNIKCGSDLWSQRLHLPYRYADAHLVQFETDLELPEGEERA